MKKVICLILFAGLFVSLKAQQDSLPVKEGNQHVLLPDSFKVIGKPVSGNAGVFSAKADGTKTANGEKFSNAAFTAACNKFKFNTWVQVTNLRNKKTVLVRINDRTSKKKKAPIMELSRAAAGVLEILKTGTAKIKIEEIVLINNKSIENEIIDSIKKPILVQDTSPTIQPDTFIIKGKSVTGIASFYSSNLDGTKTSTGERYRNNKLTAASNNFKLNTWVLVTNLKNKQTVVVRINDRMHPRMKRKGRVVDLSRDAARKLDFIDAGLTKVKVETIEFIASSPQKEKTDSLPVKTDSIPLVDSVKSIDSATAQNSAPNTNRNNITGIASFYSLNLDGTKTATGERYRNNKMTAASNDFKLNTWVRVTNLKNHRSVIVRINDRMHNRMQKKGRVVDLSRIAASRLGFLKNGLARVRVERVDKGTLE